MKRTVLGQGDIVLRVIILVCDTPVDAGPISLHKDYL